MTVTITGAVMVDGVLYPVKTEVELPQPAVAQSPAVLRVVQKAS